MLVDNLIKTIEAIAPPEIAASWDKSGIQCYSEKIEIEKMAVCLDPLPDIIAKILEWGAQFILSHHPLLLEPQLPSKNNNYYNVLKLLFKSDAWLYSAHTSLDANFNGPVKFLGKRLSLKNMKILDPINISGQWKERYGFGIFGTLSNSMSLNMFMKNLGEILGINQISLCGTIKKEIIISRIAYCPGSGTRCLKNAIEKNCDVLVTGDIKYHTAIEAQIPILDVGHHSMEECMMEHFYHELQDNLPGVNVKFFPSISPIQIINLKNLESGNE